MEQEESLSHLHLLHPVEAIDDLKTAGWSLRYVQRWIVKDEQPGLWTRIAVTENASLFALMKS
jgi:hypothetical protein